MTKVSKFKRASLRYQRDLATTAAGIVDDRRYRVPRWAVLRILALCAVFLAALGVIGFFSHVAMAPFVLDGAVLAQLLLFALALAFHQMPALKVLPRAETSGWPR